MGLHFPRSCALLRGAGVMVSERSPEVCLRPFTESERLGIFATSPGSLVPWHVGQPTRINIHLGLQGTKGARVEIGDEVANYYNTRGLPLSRKAEGEGDSDEAS